jgi:CheY-like chemotaxis protein
VGECEDGVSALAAIREQTRPGILDVQMPELDGFGLLAQLDPDATAGHRVCHGA